MSLPAMSSTNHTEHEASTKGHFPILLPDFFSLPSSSQALIFHFMGILPVSVWIFMFVCLSVSLDCFLLKLKKKKMFEKWEVYHFQSL